MHRPVSQANQVAEPNLAQEHAQDANTDVLQTEISNEDVSGSPAGDSAPLQQTSAFVSNGAGNDHPVALQASILDPVDQTGGDAGLADPLRSLLNAAPAVARSPSVDSSSIGQHLRSAPPSLEGKASSPGGEDANVAR